MYTEIRESGECFVKICFRASTIQPTNLIMIDECNKSGKTYQSLRLRLPWKHPKSTRTTKWGEIDARM